MTYDWEEKLTPEFVAELDNLVFQETGLTLAGVAIANADEGEAALIYSPTNEVSSVIEADYRKDILGDAAVQYSEAVETAFQLTEGEKDSDE